jgi:hypothetical protein
VNQYRCYGLSDNQHSASPVAGLVECWMSHFYLMARDLSTPFDNETQQQQWETRGIGNFAPYQFVVNIHLIFCQMARTSCICGREVNNNNWNYVSAKFFCLYSLLHATNTWF